MSFKFCITLATLSIFVNPLWALAGAKLQIGKKKVYFFSIISDQLSIEKSTITALFRFV